MLLENKTMMKNIKKSIWESFISVFLILLFAIVLLKNPENFISVSIHLFGYIAIFIGVIDLVLYAKLLKEEKIIHKKIMQSAILFSFGLIAFFETETLKNMITFLLGGYFIYLNASRLELSMYLKNFTKKIWIISVIISIINILLALVLIINPLSFEITNFYISILVMIIEGLFFLQNISILAGVRYDKEIHE